ncbi:MAG: PgaD family protein [Endomicrobiales bacterium]
MEKPGSWVTHPKVIDEPAIKSVLRIIVERSVNVSLWAVWMYWLLPVSTVLLWILGVDYFAETLLLSTDAEWLFTVISRSAAVLLGIFLLEAGWVRYNLRLSGKKGQRRKGTPACPAPPFTVAPDIIEKARRCGRVEVVLYGSEFLFSFPGEPAPHPCVHRKAADREEERPGCLPPGTGS